MVIGKGRGRIGKRVKEGGARCWCCRVEVVLIGSGGGEDVATSA
jgi:hypothetical protein